MYDPGKIDLLDAIKKAYESRKANNGLSPATMYLPGFILKAFNKIKKEKGES